MSQKKKAIRRNFRLVCLKRDNYKCRHCGASPENLDELDVHHITDRSVMPEGGYVPENGITLCSDCHLMAEFEHTSGRPFDGYSREDLYRLINSSYEVALKASEKLILKHIV